MSEPTQEFIVSELRRRVRASMAELMQVLGLQFASILPQEIQRMKDSGLVMYEEPLGAPLYSDDTTPLPHALMGEEHCHGEYPHS
jgi:hypothetical protein